MRAPDARWTALWPRLFVWGLKACIPAGILISYLTQNSDWLVLCAPIVICTP
jgi:hypothetical protein